MTASLGPARIGNRRETVQQTQLLPGLSRSDGGGLAQASEDR
ncbi:hypothetical protein [Streptomyces sp. NPDC126522]